MGIGFSFGPPREDGFDPSGHESWVGSRLLDEDQLRALITYVEARGYQVEEASNGENYIDAECEEFMFAANGGWLSKPGAGLSGSERDDMFETLWHLMCEICERAGWVAVGDHGDSFGFHQLPDGRHVVTVKPPEKIVAPKLSAGDVLEKVATTSALNKALASLDAQGLTLSDEDPRVATALLLSSNDRVVEDALAKLFVLSPPKSPALMARLRRLELLSDDPELASRAKALRDLLV